MIDDSRAVRLIVGNILRDQGYEVHDAAQGQEGLEKLRQNPEIGLVLVDWNMRQERSLCLGLGPKFGN